jgi:quercetin dioxygenase-like cupin family protein
MHEVITNADGAPNFSMRVFEIEPGSSTPYHSHPWEHEVFVFSGRGVVKSEAGETQVKKDSVVFIPAEEQHCFTSNGNEPLRFV